MASTSGDTIGDTGDPFSANMKMVDLSFVKQSYEEHVRYLCRFCVPDSVMIEKLDDIEFLGPNNHRYICPRCGSTYDSTDPIKRIDESPADIPTTRRDGPMFISFAGKNKDKLRGTLIYRSMQEDSVIDPEPNEDKYLMGEGINIKKTVLRSSVTGKTIIKEYK